MRNAPASAALGDFGTPVAAGRQCLSCGYDLAGLKIGARCPECGTAISGKSILRPSQSIFQMPAGYLSTLRLGGVMMLIATVPQIVAVLWFIVAVRFDFSQVAPTVLGAISSALWAGAVWLLATPRPTEATLPISPSREWVGCRWLSRLTQLLWVAGFGLFVLELSIGNPALATSLRSLALVFMLLAFAGMWPLCLYLARLCEWAEDDGLARRLRLLPWVLVLCTIVAITTSNILPKLSGGPLSFLLMPLGAVFAIGVLVGIFLTFASFIQAGNMARWVLVNRHEALASDRRRGERIAAKISVATPQRDPLPNAPSVPERIWTGPAHRKPQGNYLPKSSASDDIAVSPSPTNAPPDLPPRKSL